MPLNETGSYYSIYTDLQFISNILDSPISLHPSGGVTRGANDPHWMISLGQTFGQDMLTFNKFLSAS